MFWPYSQINMQGKATAPNTISATAIFITRNKLFLRSFFSRAKRIITSMFRMTIMALSNIKAVTTTLPSCALDGVSIIVGDVKVLVELLVTELFSILFPLPSCKRLVREMALSVSTRML